MKTTAAFLRGYGAYCFQVKREDNPYTHGYPDWNINEDWAQWDCGWLTAKQDLTENN